MAAVLRNRFGFEPEPVSCGFAAAAGNAERVGVLLPQRSDDVGNDERDFGLGSVLIWARRETREIVVIAPSDRAGTLARQATHFPGVNIYTIEGTTLAETTPEELDPIPELTDAALGRADLIRSVGARPVDDFGYLIAEMHGLEIARVDRDGTMQIGVGTADRELHGYVHVNTDPAESLRRAAEMVSAVRARGASSHPLNRRARQRWLRSALADNPSVVGAERLDLLPPLGERVLQLGPEPAASLDSTANTVYVFSAGIDPDVVPLATDYRRRHDPERTVIVTSHRDAFPATASIAAAAGIEIVAVDAPY